MNIKPAEIKFCDLQYGDIFEVDGDYCIKGYIEKATLSDEKPPHPVIIELKDGKVSEFVPIDLRVKPIHRGTFTK